MGRLLQQVHERTGSASVIPSWLQRARGWASAVALSAAAGCAHDARLETPEETAGARPIPAPRAASAAAHEVLTAEVEMLGLPLGSLESSFCTTETGSVVQTHVEPAALISA